MFSPASFFLFPTAKSVYSKLMQSPYGQRLSPLFQFLLYFREKNHTDASEVPCSSFVCSSYGEAFSKGFVWCRHKKLLGSNPFHEDSDLLQQAQKKWRDGFPGCMVSALTRSCSCIPVSDSFSGWRHRSRHSLTQGKLNRQSWDQAAISEQRHEPPLHKRVF